MAGSPEWTIEYAWQCARHGWNTCPLTEAALRFSDEPCCDEACVITTREVLTPARRGAAGPGPGRSNPADVLDAPGDRHPREADSGIQEAHRT